MEEGVVGRWIKNPGETVAVGDELVEIETDKVTVTVEAEAEGVLIQTLAAPGESILVGSLLAVIGAPGDPVVLTPTPQPLPATAVAVASPARVPAANDRRSVDARTTGGFRATPLARKLLAQAGLPLEEIGKGSGPDGRILRHDVERALSRSASTSALLPGGTEPTRQQRTIARRMTESKRDIPHYYVDTEIDMTAALQLRRELNELDPPVRVSVTDLAIRACALGLREVEQVNSSWVDDRIVQHTEVNIGIAVALEDGTLVVPVLRAADHKTIAEIAAEARELAGRARSGTLTLDDVGSGTFTVSNLGMFGIDSFHAIINPPESAILAVGAVVRRPAIDGDLIVVRSVARASLSADHRVFSGATAARFLGAVRHQLQQPATL